MGGADPTHYDHPYPVGCNSPTRNGCFRARTGVAPGRAAVGLCARLLMRHPPHSKAFRTAPPATMVRGARVCGQVWRGGCRRVLGSPANKERHLEETRWWFSPSLHSRLQKHFSSRAFGGEPSSREPQQTSCRARPVYPNVRSRWPTLVASKKAKSRSSTSRAKQNSEREKNEDFSEP